MSRVKKDIVRELHKPARKKFKRRRVIIKGLHDLWQADLADLKRLAKQNRGYKYILVVINAFSKFLWTEPLKTKSAGEVKDAMEKILDQGRAPRNLQTDAGKEFYNQQFKQLMLEHKINHYSTYSIIKAGMAERVIRTLKEKLFEYFSLLGNRKWITILDEVTKEYNNRKHRTISMKPKDVTPAHESMLLSTVYSQPKIVGRRKYSIGNVVRISKHKSLFEKGYTPNWSTELFKVTKTHLSNPVTHLLKDMAESPIKGMFYEPELQKTRHKNVYLVEKILRRKRGLVYVKFVGLDNSYNRWIHKNNVL